MSETIQSNGRRSVFRADVLPGFIKAAHRTLQVESDKWKVARGKGQESPTRHSTPDTLPFTTASKRMALKHHGAGVYEDTNTGEVWWRDGNTLRRRATDRDKLVADYLSDCRAKEGKREAALGKSKTTGDFRNVGYDVYTCEQCGGSARQTKQLPDKIGGLSVTCPKCRNLMKRVSIRRAADGGIEFGSLGPEGYKHIRTLKQSDIGKCPHVIMLPSHYRDDGTCRCDDPEHKEMAKWGYKWKNGRWAGCQRHAVAPPGKKYERMIKQMKRSDNPPANPWAVAWNQYNRDHKAIADRLTGVKPEMFATAADRYVPVVGKTVNQSKEK